jgi:hypothetical protein
MVLGIEKGHIELEEIIEHKMHSHNTMQRVSIDRVRIKGGGI